MKSPLRSGNGDFTFDLFADAATFNVFRSTGLSTWTGIGSVTVTTPNYPGTAFTDATAHGLARAFYKVGP
jgi:hypothetical protein